MQPIDVAKIFKYLSKLDQTANQIDRVVGRTGQARLRPFLSVEDPIEHNPDNLVESLWVMPLEVPLCFASFPPMHNSRFVHIR
jgi:hypothetical protein